MTEEITLNKIEKEIIIKIREHTQQNFLGYKKTQEIEKSAYSKNGLKRGCKFTDTSGNKLNITMEKEKSMKDFIINQIMSYEKQRLSRYFSLIQKDVREKFEIDLKKPYLSGIKKQIGKLNEC